MCDEQETLRLILRDFSAFWNKYKHHEIFSETTFTIPQKHLTVIEGYVLALKTKPSRALRRFPKPAQNRCAKSSF